MPQGLFGFSLTSPVTAQGQRSHAVVTREPVSTHRLVFMKLGLRHWAGVLKSALGRGDCHPYWGEKRVGMWRKQKGILHKPTLLFICPHVIHSNHAGEKMKKKKVSWKCSMQFGMVITEPETHIGSWTPYSAPDEDLSTPLFSSGKRPASQTPTISTSHGRIKLSYSCVRNLHQSVVKHWLPLPSSKQIIKSAWISSLFFSLF